VPSGARHHTRQGAFLWAPRPAAAAPHSERRRTTPGSPALSGFPRPSPTSKVHFPSGDRTQPCAPPTAAGVALLGAALGWGVSRVLQTGQYRLPEETTRMALRQAWSVAPAAGLLRGVLAWTSSSWAMLSAALLYGLAGVAAAWVSPAMSMGPL